MSAGNAGTLLPELADCCALSPELSARKMSGTHIKFRFREFIPPSDSTYALAFRWAQRAFIIADNFFRMAALIGLRPAPFFGADLPFCLAHRARCAAAIFARADALMVRRFRPLAFKPCLFLGGRPRRAGWEPSPTRAAIACSIRLASCLSCVNMLSMSILSFL